MAHPPYSLCLRRSLGVLPTSSASSSINVWRGVPYGPDDGTLAPWAVAASLPFAPEIVLPAFELKVGGYVSCGLTHVVRL